MGPAENQRASQVCSTCKARKKRCDKKLPKCGYCAGRGLDCHFDRSLPSQSTYAAVHDSATWRWGMAQSATNRVATSSANAFNTASPPLRTSLYDFLDIGKGMALSDVVYSEVSRVIEIASLSLHDISDRFFDGFHRWLPVISPQCFCKATTEIHDRPPKADFSVLLLAMCLIILRPPSSTIQYSATCFKSLYVTVKLSFAQVQAVICASTHLIQAGILIAAYEFASQRPETAYVSIGMCARMSGIVGIDRVQAPWDKGQPEAELTLQVLEKRNVWWCVIVMERLVLLEIADRNHLTVTNFSSDDLHLPLDLRHDQRSDSHAPVALQLGGPLPSTIHHSNIDGFGRQAQAIVMLDQTLRILRLSDTENARLPALIRLDGQLQAFLALIMSEYRTPGRHCGANATVIRTLFLLHQDILSQPIQATSKMTDAQYETNSWAALDAAARMMATVACHHVEHISNIDIIPVCAAYNAQIAMEHIVARRDYVDGDSRAALESLEILVRAFRQRWPVHEGLW